jgi:hypothetical protein
MVRKTESTHCWCVFKKGGAPGITKLTGGLVGAGDWLRAKNAAKRSMPVKRMRFKAWAIRGVKG